MGIRIKRRTIVVKNCLVFILLSTFFLKVITALNGGASVFNFNDLYPFLKSHITLLLLGCLTFSSVFYVKKFSKYMLATFVLYIGLKSISYFSTDMNKLILFLSFIFFICSYYFLLVWGIELRDVIYNPGFTQYDIDKRPSIPLEASIQDMAGNFVPVEIRNWDRTGCYVALKSDSVIQNLNFDKSCIEVKFKSLVVREKIVLHTIYDDGAGFKIDNMGLNSAWNTFYDLTKSRKYIG